MKLICEQSDVKSYLLETKEVNFSHPAIKQKADCLFSEDQSDLEKVKRAFEFVRDDISHSWDIKSNKVTCTASEVLLEAEGICYAKSMLLAALLRSQQIPTGFCYQRLLLFNTPEEGYCLHALNAVFLKSMNKWIRLDARGNKEGIDAQFSLDEEKLAFSMNERLDEIDYPTIYVHPNPKTVAVLNEHRGAVDMYQYHLPESI